MIVREMFKANGTTCNNCSKIIERQAKKVDGVTEVSYNYSKDEGFVEFDDSKTNIDDILFKIEEKGYECVLFADEPIESKKTSFFSNNVGIVTSFVGLLILMYFLFNFYSTFSLPELNQNMGYGLLFVVGLITGLHCVGMCGGFVLSYSANSEKNKTSVHKSHMMYGFGKTLSYTIIGAIFGLIGSIVAFTPLMRGVAGILAGLFLILFGLKMLNWIPLLRKINIRTPKFISKFVGTESKKHTSPLVIGLLNGLMIACGPLQAIYIMAAGTGSMFEGAKLLLIFGLGTLPVMLGFGYITNLISRRATHRILKFSGIVVLILGIIMINRGIALTGTGYDVTTVTNSVVAKTGGIDSTPIKMENGYQIINMDVTRNGYEPNKFVLKKGVPVKWVINGKEVNGCNRAIQVPSLNMNFDIKSGGETIIEFTPKTEGVISWSCWMGMIPGSFIVKEDIDSLDSNEVQKELDSVELKSSGSCGMNGGGGCGCGGGV